MSDSEEEIRIESKEDRERVKQKEKGPKRENGRTSKRVDGIPLV